MPVPPFEIAGKTVAAGSRSLIDIPVATLSNHTPVTLPVHVIHGRRAGPVLFVSAAIHGDEIVGIEIIRRLLKTKDMNRIRGTLLCAPVVNTFGFLAQTRYLPDRRDLNRSFPGSPSGSLASQLAHIFLNEVVLRSDAGVDLHTGAINRANLPQIRGDLSDPQLASLAQAFAAPVVLQSRIREGSLRQAATAHGIGVLLYEAGEALRLDEVSVRVGVRGIINIMREMRMLGEQPERRTRHVSVTAASSDWLRAPVGGIFSAFKKLGDNVYADETIGIVRNPYEGEEMAVKATFDGVVIGRTNISVVNCADALFHVGCVQRLDKVQRQMGQFASGLEYDGLLDIEEIV